MEGGCGWHIVKFFHRIPYLINLESYTGLTSYTFFIVNQGIKDHIPGEMTLMKSNRLDGKISSAGSSSGCTVGWAGYVETDDEYDISKFLVLQFVCSPSFLCAAEGKMFVVIAVLRFLQKHVFMSICIAITWDNLCNILILLMQQLVRKGLFSDFAQL